MTNEDAVRSLYKNYKFDKYVPVYVKKITVSSKRKSLKHILKNKKEYSLFTGISLFVFFAARKTGHALTYAQSVFVAILTGVIIALAAISTGIVLYSTSQREIIEHTAPPETANGLQKPAVLPNKASQKAPAISYKIFIALFETESNDNALGRELSATFQNKINAVLGSEGSIITAKTSFDETPYVLKGAVNKAGNKDFLTVKLIDTRSTKILYISTFNPNDTTALEKAANEIISIVK